MKKILFILAFVYTAFSYGQGGPKVDAIRFKGDVTTTARDAIDVPVGETWLIYNVTTDKVEFASSDDVWHDLTQLPLIDDNNLATATSTNVASASSVKNYVDFYAVELTGGSAGNRSADFAVMDTGTGVSGFQIVGGNDQAQINGGVVGADHSLVVGPTAIWSLSQTNSVIDTFGPTAIVTRNYTDTNYISKDSIVDSDTFSSVSPTTVPSSESVKAYVDASISGSGAVPDDTGSSNGDVLTTDGAGTYTWQTPTTGSSPPFDDNSALVRNNVDTSKLLDFDLSGLTTATTRTLTMPDVDVDLGNLGASNLDLTDNYTWTGTHNFPNITEFNSTLKIIGNVTTKFGGLILYENNGTTQTGFLGYSGSGVRMSNVTSAQVLQLLDAGGADFNGNFTADAFIKDGATSDDILLGDGTTTSLAGLGVGDPDQTLSLGGTGNKDLTISGTGGNTIDLTGVDGVDSDNIVSKGTARTSPVQYTDIYGQTQANYNTDGAPGAGELVIITDASDYIEVALSDYTTDLTTGTSKAYFRAPFAMTVTDVRASVLTAPVGSAIIVDINENGTSIMTTNKLSIDASEKTSTTAATAAGITDTSIADDAEITFDIDQVGSSTAGAGLLVKIYYR